MNLSPLCLASTLLGDLTRAAIPEAVRVTFSDGDLDVYARFSITTPTGVITHLDPRITPDQRRQISRAALLLLALTDAGELALVS